MKGRKPDLHNVIPMKGNDVAAKPVPDAPDFMSEDARRVWEELAGVLAGKDRLQPQYVYQFAAYCESVANFIFATSELAMMGYYFETETRNGRQQKKRAMWGVQQEAMAAMARGSAVFGLSPVDDARLHSGAQGDLFGQIMDQLRNGTG